MHIEENAIEMAYKKVKSEQMVELDNYHVLLEYGVDTTQAGEFKA